MKQCWSTSELAESWTLSDDEKQLSDQRTQQGRLGLAVLLKFFQVEGRFPHYHKDVPMPAVGYVAEQLEVLPAVWFDYPLKGRSGSRDREQLRAFLGFRQATVDDMEPIRLWLNQEVVPQDQDPRHLRSAVYDWCREHRIEPPSSDRIDRVVGAAVRSFETAFFAAIHAQLPGSTRQRLDALLAPCPVEEPGAQGEGPSDHVALGRLKADPRRAGLASLRDEIAKLGRIGDVQLPDDLFSGVPPKILERYRLRVSTESIDQLRRHPGSIRHTLLAAFCWQRRRAIIDGLIELLIQIVHRVSVNAERRVVTEIIDGLEEVHGKSLLLFCYAGWPRPNGRRRTPQPMRPPVPVALGASLGRNPVLHDAACSVAHAGKNLTRARRLEKTEPGDEAVRRRVLPISGRTGRRGNRAAGHTR